MRITGLDIETGGLHPEENGIISIAVLSPQKEKFYQVISPHPQLKYEDSALKINGFSLHKDAYGRPHWHHQNQTSESVSEGEALRRLVEFLKLHCQNSFVAGCNIAFDKAFLLAAARRNEKKTFFSELFPQRQNRPLNTLEGEFLHRTIELQSIALFLHQTHLIELPPNKYNPAVPSTSLDSIASAVGLRRENPSAHHALHDAELSLQILEKFQNLLTQKKPSGGPSQPPRKPWVTPSEKKTKQKQNVPYEALLTFFQTKQNAQEVKAYLKRNGFVKSSAFQKLTESQQQTLLPLIQAYRQQIKQTPNTTPPSPLTPP
jgi:DNA polymerase III epsilon subunit-like protein